MTEYIERDEAVRKAIYACIKIVGHGISHIDAVDIAEEIDSIPTADVVEVRHGEWVLDTSSCVASLKCGECDYAASIGLDVHKFCPHCGAKMDGKGES